MPAATCSPWVKRYKAGRAGRDGQPRLGVLLEVTAERGHRGASPAAVWAVVGFVVTTAVGVVLCASIAGDEPILRGRWGIAGRLAAWSVVWAIGVLCALHLPRRAAVAAVLAAAIALRLAALAGPPTLSDDSYRYAWDGRVQTAGIDPYRDPPSDPSLAHLRESWLWPDPADCAEIDRTPGCSRMNRVGVRTIYPPLAQAWFTAVYNVAGIESRHKAWQVAGLLGDVALVGVLVLALRAWGRDERWAALYALSPLAVIEVVNNAHVDGLAVLLVVLALLVAARRRPGWAGALVGAAILIKLYPALLLVAFVAMYRHRLSSVAKAVGAAAAVVAVGYLPHVLAVGVGVVGYLPGYLREEKYDRGERFLLAGLVGLPPWATTVLAAAGVVAVAAWVVLRRPALPRGCAALMGALLLATTPTQPWYGVTLLALAAVAAAPAWSVVAVAAYPYYFAIVLDEPRTVAIGQISYAVALAVITVAGVGRRLRARSSPRPLPPDRTEGTSSGGLAAAPSAD